MFVLNSCKINPSEKDIFSKYMKFQHNTNYFSRMTKTFLEDPSYGEDNF